MKIIEKAIALTSTAFMMATSSVVFSSCQEDQFSDMDPEEVKDLASELVQGNDSTFTNDFVFNYENSGTSSENQYVKDVEFGTSTNGKTRGISSLTPTGVALNVIDFVGKNFLNNVVSKGNNAVIDAILGSGYSEMEKLNELSSKIDVIADMIKNLKEQSEDNNIANMYNNRMKEYSGLDLNNTSYFTAYFNAVVNGKTEMANTIVNNWAHENINNATAPTATFNYLNMISQTISGSKKSITDIYDYWVFQTTPWEHQGYLKREQLRASDVCVAVTGYLLAYAYYENDTTGVGPAKIVKLNQAFKAFVNYYKDRLKVEHHDDKLICQIQDAHIVFNKKIVARDMMNHPWIKSGTHWNNNTLKKMMFAEVNHNADYTLSRSLTPKEAQAIYNYYNSGKGPKKSMQQIMTEVGFNLAGLTQGKTHIMTLNTGASIENEHWYNNNYFLKFDKVVDTSNANNPMLDNFSIGKMWLESKNYTKSCMRYKVLRWWDRYDADSKDFFRVDIDHRFTGTEAFD